MIEILETLYRGLSRLATPLAIFTTVFTGYQFFKVSYELYKNKIKREGSFFYMGVILYVVLIYILFQEKGMEEIVTLPWVPLLYFGYSFIWWLVSLSTRKFLANLLVMEITLADANSLVARFIFCLGVFTILLRIALSYL